MSLVHFSHPGVVAPSVHPYLIPRSQSAIPFQQWRPRYAGNGVHYRNQHAAIYQQWCSGLLGEQTRRTIDADTVIHDWILECPDTDTRYRNSLRPGEVYSAFRNVLRVVDDFADGVLPTSIQNRLMQDLRSSMEDDLTESQTMHSIQHLFRAYAYVCSRFISPAMGQVLHDFFVQNLSFIVQRSGRKSLWQYCRAIRDTCMEDHLKQDCYSRLELHRPDVLDISGVPANQDIVRQLPSLIQAVIAALRGLGLQLSPDQFSNSRPYSTRLWASDDEVDRYSSGYNTPNNRRALKHEKAQLMEELRRNREASRRLNRFNARRSSNSPSRGFGSYRVNHASTNAWIDWDSDVS